MLMEVVILVRTSFCGDNGPARIMIRAVISRGEQAGFMSAFCPGFLIQSQPPLQFELIVVTSCRINSEG